METIGSALLRDAAPRERTAPRRWRPRWWRPRAPDRGRRRGYDVVDDLRGEGSVAATRARASGALARGAPTHFRARGAPHRTRVEEPGAEHARVRAGGPKRRGSVVVPRRVVPSRNLPGCSTSRRLGGPGAANDPRGSEGHPAPSSACASNTQSARIVASRAGSRRRRPRSPSPRRRTTPGASGNPERRRGRRAARAKQRGASFMERRSCRS